MSRKMGLEGKHDTEVWRGDKSKKRMVTSQEAIGLMKKYMGEIRDGVAKGEHLIFGDGPRELVKSMGMYYLCNAYYASVLAAKQKYDYYQGILEQHGYFSNLAGGYESLIMGYSFDKNPEVAPYGGFPKPTAIIIDRADSVSVYELYAREFGCPLYFMDFAQITKVPSRWWEDECWGEPHVLDQWTKEFEGCARFLEAITGKSYSETKLREYLERADKTCEYYSKAIDLACTTVPAPISVTDAFAEVSVYNWHQGEEWVLEHARKYYEEVKERVDKGEAVCPDERVRLLWYATLPIWFSLGYYNYWEESHGAVFIARNYLSAASRIIYHDRTNPLRAMALRRHLRYIPASPTAAAEHAVWEVEKYKIDGVIIPTVRGSARGDMFVNEALKRAGVPTLQISYDPVNSRDWNDAEMKAVTTSFIESLKPSADRLKPTTSEARKKRRMK
jgi:benzoyl-CoA reductase subunit B